MGANYHLQLGDRLLHVGKSSARCRFVFEGNREVRSLADWKPLLEEGQILDGNDEPVTLEEFLALVEAKSGGNVYDPDWLDAEGNPFLLGEFS